MSMPPDYNLLKRFPNKYYIETGIYRGDSLQLALDAEFKVIYGIDNDMEHWEFCWSRFDLSNGKNRCMRLLFGNSFTRLKEVFENIGQDPATIFLDAHWQLTGERPESAFPLMKELETIMESERINDTIIIDDLLYMTHPEVTGWKLNDIKQALRRINSHYNFELIANPIVNNMLIAIP